MENKANLSLLISALLVSSSSLVAAPIDLRNILPGTALSQPPEQITVHLYNSRDEIQPVASQTFQSDEWQTTTRGGDVTYGVRFSALDTESYENLWYQTQADGITVTDRRQIRATDPNIYAEGELATGTGVRFPVGGLQEEAGVYAGDFATHTGNDSAHHTAYTNAEAWSHVLASDGPDSGLNADLLDGQHASHFVTASHDHDADYVNIKGDDMTGPLSVTNDADPANSHVKLGTKEYGIDARGIKAAGRFQDVISIVDDLGAETIRLEGDESGGGTSSILKMSRARNGTDLLALTRGFHVRDLATNFVCGCAT